MYRHMDIKGIAKSAECVCVKKRRVVEDSMREKKKKIKQSEKSNSSFRVAREVLYMILSESSQKIDGHLKSFLYNTIINVEQYNNKLQVTTHHVLNVDK